MDAILSKNLRVSEAMIKSAGVGVFVLLTALGAFVRIPVPGTPVPMTLQTLFVLLSGAFLGKRLGALSQMIYAILGFSGFSIFALSFAPGMYAFSPTAGYVVGFIFAAFFSARVCNQARFSAVQTFLRLALADSILFATGVIWLSVITRVSLLHAFMIGVVPFIIPEVMKLALATGVLRFKKN